LAWLLLVIPLSAVISITLILRDEIKSRKNDRYERYELMASEASPKPDDVTE
jgi:hypothetical protein